MIQKAQYFLFIALLILTGNIKSQVILPGFHKSIYNSEQILELTEPVWAPEVKIHINAPSADSFYADRETELVFYALPNGNTIEQTIGNTELVSEDWHYNIQHIGAQTRFLRSVRSDVNLVVCYLESTQKSWGTWRTRHPDELIGLMVDSIASILKNYNTKIVLSGHSGGGNWVFGYINSKGQIPDSVKRISFLDSNYSYDETRQHGEKLANWLNLDNKALSVLAYNDSVALYNGEPVVSPTGGTWYRSKLMIEYLSNHFTFSDTINKDFWRYNALDNRISFTLKTNPEQKILHTIQVERNGFIHALLTGTEYENSGYIYYPLQEPYHVYDSLIQPNLTLTGAQFPPRREGAIEGSDFTSLIEELTLEERETLIFKEITSGNMPSFCKEMKTITTEKEGRTCTYQVALDYLAVGSDTNFCRMPMSPELAQRIADYFGCSMPTPKMVDLHWQNADRKINPITHAPSGNDNEQVWLFVQHNNEIEEALKALNEPWSRDTTLVDGLKKDIVITNRLATNPGKVAIYGWYKLDGTYWQPLYTGHIDTYMDYSHGVRLVNKLVYIDNEPMNIRTVLGDTQLYPLLSNEAGIMEQPYYVYGNMQPLPTSPKSFGIKVMDGQTLNLKIDLEDETEEYEVYQSSDGVYFNLLTTSSESSVTLSGFNPGEMVFVKLKARNSTGTSVFSETLVAIPGDAVSNLLIVQGFDRATSGNSFDFMKYHARTAAASEITFDAATNDAVLSGLFNLNKYKYVDYVLGEESTVDETFSSSEQNLVKSFLNEGGCLFVSGAEIAWDLDYKGNIADKDFYHYYLKSGYEYDAPFNNSGTYYSVEGNADGYFRNFDEFNFDDGTHGTFNVKYADQIIAMEGSEPIFDYVGPSSDACAGIAFSGYFPGGIDPGKVVYLGFPFETIVNENIQSKVFKQVVSYFDIPYTSAKPVAEIAFSMYPNPTKDNLTIKLNTELSGPISILLVDESGRVQRTLFDNQKVSKRGEYTFMISGLESGFYYCRVETLHDQLVKKIIVL